MIYIFSEFANVGNVRGRITVSDRRSSPKEFEVLSGNSKFLKDFEVSSRALKEFEVSWRAVVEVSWRASVGVSWRAVVFVILIYILANLQMSVMFAGESQ